MKNTTFGAACILFLICSGSLWADLPDLTNNGLIKDGGKALAVKSDATPTWADWNNDGAKDLIVGQYTNGNIVLYLNSGSDLNPSFSGGQLIESNGIPITTSYG